MRSNIEIRKPLTSQEFEKYFDLRWRILREPWDLLKGSEKDELEDNSIHIAAFLDDNIIGCGRGHFNSEEQAQIRYMAVDESFQGHGVGLRILKALEEELTGSGAKEIILKAREKAVTLYKKHRYKIYRDGEILFGEIKHYWMRKR